MLHAARHSQRKSQGDPAPLGVSKILVYQTVNAANLQKRSDILPASRKHAIARKKIMNGRDHSVTSPSQKRMEQIKPSIPTAPAR